MGGVVEVNGAGACWRSWTEVVPRRELPYFALNLLFCASMLKYYDQVDGCV